MSAINKMTKYIFLINYTKDHIIIYFITYNFFVLLIIISSLFFMVIAIKFKNNNNISLRSLSILQFIIPFISTHFFGQILYTLLTIFFCEKNTHESFFSSSHKCFRGKLFDIQAPFSIISILFLFMISYITNSLYYNPLCLRAKNRKIHSLSDIVLLLTKILMNLSFLLLKNEEDNFPLLILFIIFTGINVYCLVFYQEYSNKNLFFINVFLSITLFWGFCCLFFGKIFNQFEFKGAYYLFFFGILFILICLIFKPKTDMLFYLLDKSNIDSSFQYYKYMIKIQTLIENKNKSRENRLLLNSFLSKQKELCFHNDCYLKKYLKCLSNGVDSDILLYYFVKDLYEFGLKKFNEDLYLKLEYIYFLLKRLSKKKKALIEFETINDRIFSIDKLFNIFRCKKLLEALWTGFDGKDKENMESIDVIKLFEYKNDVNKFKSLLNKISLLYYDFWLALFSNNYEGKEQFKELNDIGIKINKLLIQIEQSFNLIYSINKEDYEIVNLYKNYIKNILNDNEKLTKCHQLLSSFSIDFSFNAKQIDYSNFDINELFKKQKEKEFLIISANSDNSNYSKILNMTTGLTPIIGYQQNEIIGKDINILIPKIFHKSHDKIFRKSISKAKLGLYQSLSNEVKYNPEILSKSIFCKTKFNYLIPLEFDSYLVQNEEGEHIYILEIKRSSSFPTTWNETGDKPPCCVLTDRNFIIQTFTPNCCELLGFNSNMINSNFEITSFILQFNEDNIFYLKENLNCQNERSDFFSGFFNENSDLLSNSNYTYSNLIIKSNKKLNIIPGMNRHNSLRKANTILKQIQNNNYDKTKLAKIGLKRKLIQMKYETPQIINWKTNNNEIQDLNSELKNIEKINRVLSNKINEIFNKKLELHVKECRISNNLIGYYFYFNNLKAMDFELNENGREVEYFNRYISNTADNEQSDYKINDSLVSKKNLSFISENEQSESRLNDTLKKTLSKKLTDEKRKSGFYLTQMVINSPEEEDEKDEKVEKDKNIKTELYDEKNDSNKVFHSDLKIDLKELNLPDYRKEKEKLNEDKDAKIFKKLDSLFVPSNFTSFNFNLEAMSYEPKKPKNFLTVPKKEIKRRSSQVTSLLTFYQNKILSSLQEQEINEEEENQSRSKSNNSQSESESSSFSDSNESEYFYKSSSNLTSKIIESKVDENDIINNISFSSRKINSNLLKIETEKSFFDSITPKHINKGRSSSQLTKFSEFQNNYYKINFKKIRYFNYDFDLGTAVEIKNYEKLSQMEIFFNTNKKTEDSFLHKIMLNNQVIMQNNNKKKESKFGKNNSGKQFSSFIKPEVKNNNHKNNDNKENKDTIDKRKELEYKIKIALNQEDKQILIQIFLIISLISLLILIFFGILINYFIINEINNFKGYIKLICYTSELRLFYNQAVYYLRELTLVNFVPPKNKINDSYIKYPEYSDNKTNYIRSLKDKIYNVYNFSHTLTASSILVNVELSNKTKTISEKNFTIFILQNDLSIYCISTSYSLSLIQINAALNHLVSDSTIIQQNTTDVYFFIFNYQNKVGEKIKAFIEIYIEDVNLKIKEIKNTIFIGGIFIFVIFMIEFIIISISYKSILIKKTSYIEGLYRIKLDLIKQSIENCELFIYTLKKQNKDKIFELDNENNSLNEDEEHNIKNDKSKINNRYSFDRKIKDDNDNFNKINTHNIINNNKNNASIIIFGVLTFCYYILIYISLICLYAGFYMFMSTISRNSIFMFHIQRKYNSIFELFNCYREYMFDPNSITSGYNSLDYLLIKDKEIFSLNGNDTFLLETTYSLINQYEDIYKEFKKKNLCTWSTGNYFNNEDECLNFLEGQMNYGYEVVSFALHDLIFTGKNIIEYFMKENLDIVGNLSEFGKNSYDDILENQVFRLSLFNNKTIHCDLNVLFSQSLIPYITKLINDTSNFIIDSFENSDSKYYIFLVCYILFNIFIYLIIWIPFIKNMNSVIYNSKKILGIIPIHVLTTLVNIKKILNLEREKDD